MEKLVICIMLFVMVIFSACKKESTSSQGEEYIEGWTTVLGVKGSDASRTSMMHARTETVGLLLVEDNKLRAELISYTPLPNGQGRYTVKMTNKQAFTVMLRWNWDELAPTSIEPDDATSGTPFADALLGNQVKTYIVIAKAVVGRLYVKAEKREEGGFNSSTLILEITSSILPITFTSKSIKREGDRMVVKWSTDAPGDVDKFIIMWSPTGDRKDEVLKAELPSIATQKDYITTFSAIKKLK